MLASRVSEARSRPGPGEPRRPRAVLRSPAARDPPPRAGGSTPRPPAPRRARRLPPAPLPATRRATRATRWPDTRNSRGRASGTSYEPRDYEPSNQRGETHQEEGPAGGLLHGGVGRRRERRAADPGNEPAGLERQRSLVHLVQGGQDERQGEGTEGAQPGRDPTPRREPPTALRFHDAPGARLQHGYGRERGREEIGHAGAPAGRDHRFHQSRGLERRPQPHEARDHRGYAQSDGNRGRHVVQQEQEQPERRGGEDRRTQHD